MEEREKGGSSRKKEDPRREGGGRGSGATPPPASPMKVTPLHCSFVAIAARLSLVIAIDRTWMSERLSRKDRCEGNE